MPGPLLVAKRHLNDVGGTASRQAIATDANDRIGYSQSLRGVPELDERTKREMASVGGLRDTHNAMSRVPSVASFGKKLGTELLRRLKIQHEEAAANPKGPQSWAQQACACIGADNPTPNGRN